MVRRSIGRIVLHGAAVSMSLRVAGVGLSYAANILISRSLGVDAFGEYVIALSWALVLTLPAKAGFDNSALRYASIYFERDDFGALRGFVGVGSLNVIIISLLIGAVMVIAGSHLVPVGAATRAWSAFLILPLALLAFYSVLMRTTRRIVSAQIYDQVLRPSLFIAALGAATLLGVRLSPASAMALTVAASAGALAGLLVEWWRVHRPARAHAPRYDEWRKWMAVSVPLLMAGVVQELMNQVDILLLGYLADARQAALFAASWRLASLVPFALVGLATMAGPLIAAAYERRSVEEMNRVSNVVARAGFGFALVAAVALYVLGAPLLGLFGPEFVAARDMLTVLLLGGIVNAFTGVVVYFTTLTGRERKALAIFAGSLALSIILNVILIPRYGALGAAAASSAATAAWNLVMLIYVRRTLGIDASAIGLRPRMS